MLELSEIRDMADGLRTMATDIEDLMRRGSSDDFKDTFITQLSDFGEVLEKLREVGYGPERETDCPVCGRALEAGKCTSCLART